MSGAIAAIGDSGSDAYNSNRQSHTTQIDFDLLVASLGDKRSYGVDEDLFPRQSHARSNADKILFGHSYIDELTRQVGLELIKTKRPHISSQEHQVAIGTGYPMQPIEKGISYIRDSALG
jgi:hypothetical protein